MNQKDREILEQFSEMLLPEIKAVSKRFAPSVESEVKETPFGFTFSILASEHIITLIDGRKPTSANAVPGRPNLQQILLEWAKAKGISPRPNEKGVIPTMESLSFAMAKSMHKKGDLLFQRGGGNDIFANIITKSRIDSLFSLLQENYFTTIESQIIKNIE